MELGFEKPSAIQQRAIQPIVRGRDVIAQAQSGTGKTASIGVSVLQKLDIQLRETQALILSPTRELAVQMQKVRFERHLGVCLCSHSNNGFNNGSLILLIRLCWLWEII